MATLEFSPQEIATAFKKLKRAVYYDKTDLAIRRRLSLFESTPGFKERLESLGDVLNNKNPIENEDFLSWINKIRYRIVPKKIVSNTSATTKYKAGTFITNRTSSKSFDVVKVNYFFDGPIELQLIAVLWIMREGRFLDNSLGPECYGARLEPKLSQQDDTSSGMFLRYHDLYKKWRDSGIHQAKHMLSSENKSVCILGLDIQEYYYHVRLDYKEISNALRNIAGPTKPDNIMFEVESPSMLLNILKFISEAYFQKISIHTKQTHSMEGNKSGLPIGLASSPLLANWYLKKLDDIIKDEIRPAYYGRYVDDIFLVVSAPTSLSEVDPIDDFIKNLFVKTNILKNLSEEKYEISCRPGLFLQKDKCILQYFDVDFSIAALEKFQKKLEANGSDFLLLPVDEGDNSLEDVAYELLYDGSINKFRSVKGIAENRYELAKHLARQTMLHLLTDENPDPLASVSLIDFFKGKNAIEFHDLWERVFTFLLISKDYIGFSKFERNLIFEIMKTEHLMARTTKKLQQDLTKHLERSAAMALALGDLRFRNPVAGTFRKANLLRHHFVRTPLMNYTTHSGSLTSEERDIVSLDAAKIQNSPRFVNFDECMLLVMSGKLANDQPESGTRREQFDEASEIFAKINRCRNTGIDWSETLHLEARPNV